MPTFDEKIDEAQALLHELDATGRRDHESSLSTLGAAVDVLDAHVQASFSAADAGPGPETRVLQQQVGDARAEYERMKAARGEARAGHRRALSQLLQTIKQSWQQHHAHR